MSGILWRCFYWRFDTTLYLFPFITKLHLQGVCPTVCVSGFTRAHEFQLPQLRRAKCARFQRVRSTLVGKRFVLTITKSTHYLPDRPLFPSAQILPKQQSPICRHHLPIFQNFQRGSDYAGCQNLIASKLIQVGI